MQVQASRVPPEFCLKDYSPKKVLIVAEIGTGHQGKLARACELIAAAQASGADCAKFQCVFADEILHPNTGMVNLPTGSISLYEHFRSSEKNVDFYQALKAECEKAGLIFMCSAFGPKSAHLLQSIGTQVLKIASPELNYVQLLQKVSQFRMPLILSTGVSKLSDIEAALDIVGNGDNVALLHCVTAYPAPEKDYNLRLLPALQSIFGVHVGVSDHSMDALLVPVLAIAMGASIIEKHICLSRKDMGLDDPIALEPKDFGKMVSMLRKVSSQTSPEILGFAKDRWGESQVEGILGTGNKQLAPSETANYSRTNRSLHAKVDIVPGDTFLEENVAIVRTEKILTPGLPPSFLPHVLNRIARKPIPSGQGITWEDLGDLA